MPCLHKNNRAAGFGRATYLTMSLPLNLTILRLPRWPQGVRDFIGSMIDWVGLSSLCRSPPWTAFYRKYAR